MKIGNSTEVQKLDTPRHADNKANAVGKPSVSTDEPVDKVESADKVELSQTSQSARHDSMPVRVDKVALVRAAIERGEFPVNPTKVAERMIDQAVELINLIMPAAASKADDAGQVRDVAGAVGRRNGTDA